MRILSKESYNLDLPLLVLAHVLVDQPVKAATGLTLDDGATPSKSVSPLCTRLSLSPLIYSTRLTLA